MCIGIEYHSLTFSNLSCFLSLFQLLRIVPWSVSWPKQWLFFWEFFFIANWFGRLPRGIKQRGDCSLKPEPPRLQCPTSCITRAMSDPDHMGRRFCLTSKALCFFFPQGIFLTKPTSCFYTYIRCNVNYAYIRFQYFEILCLNSCSLSSASQY